MNTAINALVGDNGGRTDNVINCYYNSNYGDNRPGYITYAFDEVPLGSYFVGETLMKSDEFAVWLSSNLYAGTFERGSASDLVAGASTAVINGGYPYIYITELAKYDVSYAFGDDTATVITIWNLVTGANTDASSFFNGVVAYYDADEFRYFDPQFFEQIITNDKLRIDLPILTPSLQYTFSARVYGKHADFTADYNSVSGVNVLDIANAVPGVWDLSVGSYSSVNKPNLVVYNIKPEMITDYETPWGLWREG